MLNVDNSPDTFGRYYDSLSDVPCKIAMPAEPSYKWHQGKLYQQAASPVSIPVHISRSMWTRALMVCTIALATLGTLGFIWISTTFRSWVAHVMRKHDTVQKSVQIFVKTSAKIDKDFKLNKFLGTDFKKQIWECQLNTDVFKPVHDQVKQHHPDLPPLFVTHPMKEVRTVPTMEGISLLAYYLSQKTGQNQLHVCKTLSAFQKRLERLKSEPQDQKFALIVTTHDDVFSSDRRNDLVQHLVPICVEKKDGAIRLCVLDSGNIGFYNYDRVNFHGRQFNSIELICSYIKEAALPSDTKYYFSGVKRQIDAGCYVYALKDAMSFLQEPDFWNRIEIFSGAKEKGTLQSPYKIYKLPPNFIKFAQSIKLIKRYLYENPDESDEKVGRSKRTLAETLTRHTLTTRSVRQNRIIDQRVLKYRMLLLFMLGTQSDAQLNQMIDCKLCK